MKSKSTSEQKPKRRREAAPGGSGQRFDDPIQEARDVESFRAGVEAGNGDDVLGALYEVCWLPGEPMPDWLRTQVATSIGRYLGHKCRTLDDAFGVKRPRSYRQHTSAERRTVGFLVYNDVSLLVAAGAVTDEGLFDAVGKRRAVGATKAKEFYYKWRKRYGDSIPKALDELPPALQSLAPDLRWKRKRKVSGKQPKRAP